MEAPLASLLRRWQVVQSLPPMSSRPLSPAALVEGVVAEGVVAEVSVAFVSPELPQAAAKMVQDRTNVVHDFDVWCQRIAWPEP